MALHIISKQHLEQLLTAFTTLKLAMKRPMELAIRKIEETCPGNVIGNFRRILRNRSAQPQKPKLRRLPRRTPSQAARLSSGSPDRIVHVSFAQYQSSSQIRTRGQGSGRYRRLASGLKEEPAAPRPKESKTTAEYKKWLRERTQDLGQGY